MLSWLLFWPIGGSHLTKDVQGRADVHGLEFMASEYKDEIGSFPPIENQDFFEALGGKNKLNRGYLPITDWPRDKAGRFIDVWEDPFSIEIKAGKIVVHSPTLDRELPTY